MADDSAALALIKNVEAVRKATPPFKARCNMKSQRGQEPASEQRFTLEYDSLRYRMAAISSRKRVVIFDGAQLLESDGAHSCVITAIEKPSSGLAFDPRLIGILPFYRPDFFFDDRLAYRHAASIDLAGSETISNVSTTKVRIVDRYGQTVTFWIEPQAPFRVHRYELIVPTDQGGVLSRYVADSTFPEGTSKEWLPQSITIRGVTNREQGPATDTTKLQLEDLAFGVKFTAETWTLAGLNLPAGQPVAELRIKQRTGYWNGAELVPEPVP